MRTALLLLVAMLASLMPADAQNLFIAGKVRDETGQPIAGVEVRLQTRSRGAVITSTDAKGDFLFTFLDVETYPVSFYKAGYTSVTHRMEVSFEGESKEERTVILARAK